jgi:hypothetical protein
MHPGLIHDNAVDYFCSLIVDTLIFLVKAIYFLGETVFLTLLPDRLRQKKVSDIECLAERGFVEKKVNRMRPCERSVTKTKFPT